MSASNDWENKTLLLMFNNDAFAGIGDTAGIQGSSADGNLYASLHTSDPGEAGDQTTNECDYTSYARVAVARTTAGWTVTSNSVSPAAQISFPEATGGSNTATHMGIGTDASGAGTLLFSGALTPNIVIANGTTPRLTTSTAITLD